MEQVTRRFYILKLIVEEFIKTAKPVGSKTLIDAYDLSFSSATINYPPFARMLFANVPDLRID